MNLTLVLSDCVEISYVQDTHYGEAVHLLIKVDEVQEKHLSFTLRMQRALVLAEAK